jgi:hypothetical protein
MPVRLNAMTRARGARAPDPLAVRQQRERLVLSQAALAHVVTQALRVGSLTETRRQLDAGKEAPLAAVAALQARALRAAVSETTVRRIERGDRVEGHALLPVLVWLELHPAPDTAGPSSEQAAGAWLRELRERFGISRRSMCNHATGLVSGDLGVRMTNLSPTTLIALETSADGVPGPLVIAKVVRGFRAHDVPIEQEHVLRAFLREADDEGAWVAGAEQTLRKTIAGTVASVNVPDGDTLAHSHELAQSIQGARRERSQIPPRESPQPTEGVLTPELVDVFAMLRALDAIRS